MKKRPGVLKLAGLLLALGLVAAACGSEGEGFGGGDGGGDTAAIAGFTIPVVGDVDLSGCPEDWSDTRGVDGDQIRLGISLPQSGTLAAFGAIGEGMQVYFDWINDNDPILDKEIVLVQRDDAYDAARTATNVEEMLETEDIFAFTHILGSANNGAARPILDEECVPQLFNATGLPDWGDPADYPWTVGGLLAYTTEANIWCDHAVAEVGEGATVAGLFVNNDFGIAYQVAMQACAADGKINLVENVVHDQSAADITNELTTLAASDADVFVLGSTGAFCPQAMAGVDQSPWEPLFLLSNTCASIGSFFSPIDPAGEGVRLACNNKEITDAAFADDPAVQEAIAILEDAGKDPFSGSISTGILFAKTVEAALRVDAADGSMSRTGTMEAVWNLEFDNPLLRDGIEIILDGGNDAYAVEGAYICEYRAPAIEGELGSYDTVSELLSVEGQTGTFGG